MTNLWELRASSSGLSQTVPFTSRTTYFASVTGIVNVCTVAGDVAVMSAL
jgi:hypothetical protein